MWLVQAVGLILQKCTDPGEQNKDYRISTAIYCSYCYPDEHLAKTCGENAATILKRMNEFLSSKVFETILCGIPESFQRTSLP